LTSLWVCTPWKKSCGRPRQSTEDREEAAVGRRGDRGTERGETIWWEKGTVYIKRG